MSRYQPVASEDEERLPEGMRRVGYDADTQTYTYEDEAGAMFEGPAGARFGELLPVGTERPPMTPAQAITLKRLNAESWRYMLPFFLLIAVFFLVLIRYLGAGSSAAITTGPPCPPGSLRYKIQTDDTCWSIALDHGGEMDDFLNVNPYMDCKRLIPGKRVCVPVQE